MCYYNYVLFSITETFKRYLDQHEPFHAFGLSHLMVLALAIFICLILPLYSKKYLTTSSQILTGILLGFLVTVNFIGWYVILFLSGTFDISLHLPLQLCHMGNLFILPVMINRNRKWFDILYFWVMAGTLQAIITPDIEAEFPHYWFLRYWIVHAGPVLCIVYASVVYELRPTWKALWQSFLSLNILALLVTPVNLIVGSNYLYLREKPTVASLMDYLGDWPTYILALEIIGFILFVLVYLPFWTIDLLKKRKGNTRASDKIYSES